MKTHTTRFRALVFVSGLAIAAVFCAVSCSDPGKKEAPEAEQPKTKPVPALVYSVVNIHAHDTTAFTEGLLFHDNKMFESTGDVEYLPQTKSAFGTTDLQTGKLDIKTEIDRDTYFGEGICILNDKLYQVTLDSHVGFVYDAKTFKKTGQFNYPTQGWGMTTDGKSLIMSDGTYNISYLDPKDFKVVKTLAVTESGYGLDHLNELEYIKGFIYANVWLTNYIVKIDPETGEVVGKLDLDDLNVKTKAKFPRAMEMNGIAYDASSDKIYVTGKLWPNIFEISFPH